MRLEPLPVIYWIAGVAVSLLLIAIILPILGQPSCINGKVVMRQSNMRSIATAMRNYVAEHDGQLVPPAQWHEIMDPWLGIGRDDPIYFADFDSQFSLLPIPWEDHRLTNGLDDPSLSLVPFLVAEQHLNENWTSVAFWDGSVRGLSDKEFVEQIDLTNAIPIGKRVSREDLKP